MNEEILTGFDWIAACLSPWAVSPHPNFAVESLSPAAELALVTERRHEREKPRYDGKVDIEHPWQEQLISTADASLYAQSQKDATDELWRIAGDVDKVAGARVAAALYASLGSAETGKLAHAIESLQELHDELLEQITSVVGERSRNSWMLALQVVNQQRMARLTESHRYNEALELARGVVEALRGLKEADFENFETSLGTVLDANEIQRDIVKSLLRSAVRTVARFDDEDIEAWSESIQTPPAWRAARASFVDGQRDEYFLRDSFERKIESIQGTRVFMRSTPIAEGYSALLLHELSGSIDDTARARENLAKVLMLDEKNRANHTREAMRLLRGTASHKTLKSVALWARNSGPSSALVEEAQSVIAQSETEGWLGESDLIVLGAAAEFLSSDERVAAVLASFQYLKTVQPGSRADWSALDKVWSTNLQLIGDPRTDSLVMTHLADLLESPDLLTTPLSNTLARIFAEIDWSGVDPAVRTAWKDWALSSDSEETADLKLAVHESHPDLLVDPESVSLIDRCILFANDSYPNPTEADLRTMSTYLIDALDSESADALQGRFSVGGVNKAGLSVAYALRVNDAELWDSIARHLTHTSVDRSQKTAALDRITENIDAIPDRARTHLAESSSEILNTPSRGLFGSETPSGVFAPGLRFLSKIGALDEPQRISMIMELAAGSDKDRLQAARSIPDTIDVRSSVWGVVLLLQLTHDGHPSVRSQAVGNLLMTSGLWSSVFHAAHARVAEMLAEPGLQTRVTALNALKRQARAFPEMSHVYLGILEGSGSSSMPRIISRLISEVKFELSSR